MQILGPGRWPPLFCSNLSIRTEILRDNAKFSSGTKTVSEILHWCSPRLQIVVGKCKAMNRILGSLQPARNTQFMARRGYLLKRQGTFLSPRHRHPESDTAVLVRWGEEESGKRWRVFINCVKAEAEMDNWATVRKSRLKKGFDGMAIISKGYRQRSFRICLIVLVAFLMKETLILELFEELSGILST